MHAQIGEKVTNQDGIEHLQAVAWLERAAATTPSKNAVRRSYFAVCIQI
jgi:hypothetical protein